MGNAFRKIAKNSVLFSIGVIASKAINILLLPLYTDKLSDTEYGIASTVTAFVTTFSIVVMMSLRAALMRFYNEYDRNEQKRFVGTVVTFVVANGVFVILLLIYPLRGILSSLLFKEIEFYPIVLLGIGTLVFDAIYLTYQSVLQAAQDGKNYSINSIIYLLAQASFNIFLITVLKYQALGMVLSLFASNVIFSIYGIVSMHRNGFMVFACDIPMLKKALKYSIPILPHNLSTTISTYVSKIMLNVNVSYAATGLFTVASQISTALGLVQTSINLALRPWFNEQMAYGDEGRNNIKKFSLFVFSVFNFLCILISLFSPEIFRILTNEVYHEAWRLVPILTLSLVVSFIYYIHVLIIMYNINASKYVGFLSVGSCIINILLSYLLINSFESFGAAFATLFSQAVLALATVLFSTYIDKLDLGIKNMLLQIAFTVMNVSAGMVFNYFYNIEAFCLWNITYRLLFAVNAFIVLIYLKRKQYLMMFKSNKFGDNRYVKQS